MSDQLGNGIAAQAPASIDASRAKPWGFWATAGFSAIVLIVFALVAVVTLVVFALFEARQNPELDIINLLQDLSSNGLFFAVTTIMSAPICTGLALLFAKLRRGSTVREYLGFKWPARKEFVRWLLVLGIFLVLFDVLNYLLGRPIVPAFMVDIYKTARFAPALYVALIVMAPVFEEVLFRGFLFEGIRHSPLGAAGALAITASSWAIIHAQYGAFDIGVIFVMGLLFGTAKLRTNSTYATIAMHSLTNFVATVELLFYVHVFS